MDKEQLKELARILYEGGMSLRETAEAIQEQTGMSISKSTIGGWAKSGEWRQRQEIPEIKARTESPPLQRGVARRLAVTFADIETAGAAIRETAIENLKATAIAQRKITKTLDSFEDEIPPHQIAQFTNLLKAQSEVSRSMAACWDILETAGRVAEFMAENAAIDIEFEEYQPEDFAQ